MYNCRTPMLFIQVPAYKKQTKGLARVVSRMKEKKI